MRRLGGPTIEIEGDALICIRAMMLELGMEPKEAGDLILEVASSGGPKELFLPFELSIDLADEGGF
jgi:nitrogenase molybdenum-iron protein alpha/beta subunit